MNALRLMVVAGEASGDAHAAAAVRALREQSPEAEVFGMGGAALRAEGVDTVFDAGEASVMGLSEVISRLPRLARVLRDLARVAAQRRPAAALLVDLPDFNLRLAARLRRLGIPVVYYVSPMVWAWRAGRTRQLARDTAEVLCILPFEPDFLRRRGVNATFVGHPLLDDPAPDAPSSLSDAEGLRLAVLPGSRWQEIDRLLPAFLGAAAILGTSRPVTVAIPVPPTVDRDALEARVRALRPAHLAVHLVPGHARGVLRWSHAALVKSGTATLEAALEDRPAVVAYRAAPLTALVARRVLRVPHVSLVNLLAERPLVPELLQERANPEALAGALEDVLARREEIVAGYRAVRAALGTAGAARKVAARWVAAVGSGRIV